jgi:hypothetical protein
MSFKKLISGISSSLVIVAGMPIMASAASNVIVSPTNTHGWTTDDTRPGGNVSFVSDSSSPAGSGALKLTTDSTTTSKAQYMHSANVSLSDVDKLSYFTKQNSASFDGGAPSYQLPVNLNGTSGFTTFVYEPYENGTVTNGEWQSWDVDSGQFWSSRSVTCSNGAVVAGGGGAPFYSLSQIKTMCPDAVVTGFGVNVGSNNPNYNVETDLVDFNGTTYDFERYNTPQDKDDCKKDSYKNLTDNNGNGFKNQGACVSYVAKQQ